MAADKSVVSDVGLYSLVDEDKLTCPSSLTIIVR